MRRLLVFPIAILLLTCSRPAAVATDAPSPTATVGPTKTSALTTPPNASSTTAVGVVRYVAIGASDTVGVGAADPATGSWPARVAALLPPGSAYVNLGVSGSVAVQAKEQQLPGAIAQHPTVVSIWLAVNDMNATIEPTSYRAAIASIVDALVAQTSATIFIGNVPDVRGVPAYKDHDPAQLAALIDAYNDAIASVVGAHPGRAVLVDLHTGSAGLVSTITVSGDGFHPSDEGYRLIAERFAAAMRASGVPLRST